MQEKKELHMKLLEELFNEIKKLNNYQDKQSNVIEIYDGIRFSDKPNNYRNKCEFSIGKDGAIGFRLGSYRDNNIKVVKPSKDCPLLNDKMIRSIDAFEKFMKSSELTTYDMYTNKGNLKQITIRTSESGCMLIVQLNKDESLSEIKLSNEIEKLKSIIQTEADFVNSVYVQLLDRQSNDKAKRNLLTHVYGDFFLIQKMRNDELQFRISPFAFFQVSCKLSMFSDFVLDLDLIFLFLLPTDKSKDNGNSI